MTLTFFIAGRDAAFVSIARTLAYRFCFVGTRRWRHRATTIQTFNQPHLHPTAAGNATLNTRSQIKFIAPQAYFTKTSPSLRNF